MRYYIEEDTSTTPPTLAKVPICGSYINYNTAPIGSIQQYSGTSLPPGWLFCNGSAYNRTYFPFLFKVIGTTYGSGDGSTTFNVPNIPDLATGIKYIIKAYSTADAKELGIDPGEVYTTTETRVGTWIDGKPIYRAAFDSGVLTDVNVLNTRDLIQYSALAGKIGTIINYNANATFNTTVYSNLTRCIPFTEFYSNMSLSLWTGCFGKDESTSAAIMSFAMYNANTDMGRLVNVRFIGWVEYTKN